MPFWINRSVFEQIWINLKLIIFSFLDDIIKLNRSQRRKEPRKARKDQKVSTLPSRNQNASTANRNNSNNNNNKRNNRKNDNRMEISSTGGSNKIQKASRNGKVIVRSNSGRPAGGAMKKNLDRRGNYVASSTPGLRQPWQKLPVAALPAEPLKISIRNELAEKPVRHHNNSVMMDMDSSDSSYRLSAGAPVYEPRDSVAIRDEYRIGNRFSTQGMAIDYQLPSGASYDTRPTRRY